VRHSTRLPKKTFAFDLHVLSTPPAFVLSQDQTLQFDILHRFPGSYRNKSSLYNLELQRCPVSCLKQVHVGPFAVVVIQLSRIVSSFSLSPKARGLNPQRAVNLTDQIFYVNQFFALFVRRFGGDSVDHSRSPRIVRTAANYLIGMHRSRGK
jgi:hypothetical protein